MMSLKQIRYGLMGAGLIVVSVLINVLMMQPDGRGVRPDRPYRGLSDLPGTPSTTVADTAAMSIGSQMAVPPPSAIGTSTAATGEKSQPEGVLLRTIQVELAKRGYVSGNSDGTMDIVTRAAILAFEHDRGLDLTAEPSAALLAELRSDVPLAIRPVGAKQNIGTEARAVIKTVQQSLSLLGYRLGAADGVVGHATSSAIRSFERDQQLPETGRISGLLLTRLAQRSSDSRMTQR